MPKFINRFGSSVKIKSLPEELLICICVGSLFDWGSPFEEVSEYNFGPSLVSMPLGYQEEDLALKSSVITNKDGLCLLILLKRFSN